MGHCATGVIHWQRQPHGVATTCSPAAPSATSRVEPTSSVQPVAVRVPAFTAARIAPSRRGWVNSCPIVTRSEEHTSELQSHSFISYAVFCLKKQKFNIMMHY